MIVSRNRFKILDGWEEKGVGRLENVEKGTDIRHWRRECRAGR